MRCNITTRDHTTRMNVYQGQPVKVVQPALAGVLRASIVVMLDNQEVCIDIDASEMVQATDHYDNHANAKRVIAQAVDQAFARFLK
jgi:HSP20 family molecular chaperone IbpA